MKEELFVAIDFETTGLDPKKHEIIEMGWVTGTRDKILSVNNYLVQPSDMVTQEIEELTGITNKDLEVYGRSHAYVFHSFFLDLYCCGLPVPKYFMGYNSHQFDQVFFERYIKNAAANDQALIPLVDQAKNTEWIDVMTDIEYDKKYKSKKLRYLAYDHDVILQDAHRACFDALATFKIFQKYDLNTILETRKNPLVTVRAQLTGLPADKSKREWAKSRGFRFDGDAKTWTAKVRINEYHEMLDWAPTHIEII